MAYYWIYAVLIRPNNSFQCKKDIFGFIFFMVNNFVPVLSCHLMSCVRCKAKPVENHCYNGSIYITKTLIFPCLCRTSFNQYLLSLWESI